MNQSPGQGNGARVTRATLKAVVEADLKVLAIRRDWRGRSVVKVDLDGRVTTLCVGDTLHLTLHADAEIGS